MNPDETAGETTGRVVRVRRGQTYLPNATVYDARLSYGALGLLLALMARPEDARKGYRALQGRGMGEVATRNALRELDEAGYRHLFRRSAGRGGIKTDVVISESPMTRDEAEAELRGSAPLIPRVAGAPVDKPGDKPLRRLDYRGHDRPWHGQARHVSNETQVLPSLRSGSNRGDQRARESTPSPCTRLADGVPCRHHPDAPECPHGMPHDQACAQCRAPRI